MISYNAIRKNKTLLQVIDSSEAEQPKEGKSAAASPEKDKKE